MSSGALALLAAIASVAYGLQTITGFGAVVFGVAMGANVVDIDTVVLLMLPLSVLQCGYVAGRHPGQIDRRLLLRWIAPIMGGGTALGAVLATRVGGPLLLRALATAILLPSLWEIGVRLRWWGHGQRALGGLATATGLALAGVMHGLYGTGGPLLVYTVGRSSLDKGRLRTTLNVVWLVLNAGLVTFYALQGRYDAGTLTKLAVLIPAMVLGVAVGERLHDRVDGELLRLATFVMLALASLALLLR